MDNWSFKVDAVPASGKSYRAGEVSKESVANITGRKEERQGTFEGNQEADSSEKTIQEYYPHLYQVMDERNPVPILVPSHSSWFNPERIHEIERRSIDPLLSTFEGESTYMRVRNKIFKLFQSNPNNYLNITQCRRVVPEDISLIIKVHSFLEHWGLINYKVGVRRDVGQLIEKIGQRELFNLQKGTSAIEETAPKAESPRMVTVGESSIPAPTVPPSVTRGGADAFRDMSKTHSSHSNGPRMTYIPSVVNCTHCNKQMHGLKGVDIIYFADRDRYILCKKCFDEGRYPSTLSYSNFHQLEAGIIRQVWSTEEEMLLVEGIEKYKDDWTAVASYVKTKTVEQCVLHFLKMEIQDPFVEMEALSFPEMKIPFNYSLNPVMTTVAFLASVVHPGVAGEAAKAAVKEIRRLSEEKSKAGTTSEETTQWINGRLNEIAAVALAACISRAEEQKVLEEGKKERLLEVLVESELKRIEAKITEYTDLAQTLQREREDLEKMRATYRKAHFEARREVSEIISKVKRLCEGTGRSFEDLFFK